MEGDGKVMEWCGKVMKGDGMVWEGDGMVREGDGMVWEGDGMLLEGDGTVWEGDSYIFGLVLHCSLLRGTRSTKCLRWPRASKYH